MTVNFLELVKDTNPLIQGTQMILKRIKTFTPTHVIMKLQSTKDGENLKAQGKGGHFFLTDYQLTSQHQQWKSETVKSYFPQHTKGRFQMRTLSQIELSFKNGVFVR